MTGFSPSCLQVVDDFARELGLDAWPAPDGSFNFEFAQSGLLTLTSSVDGTRVVVSLARQPERSDAQAELRFFRQARFDPTTSRFLHAGLAEDGLLLGAISVEAEDFSLQSLDQILQQLMAMHDAARR